MVEIAMKYTDFSEGKIMRMLFRIAMAVVTILILVSCSSTDSQIIYTPGSSDAGTGGSGQSLEQQEQARQQAAEERRLAEAREAERLARQAQEAERQAQMRAERERVAAEEAARAEAQRQRELAARRAAEQARVVAAQQARIDELRERIAANESETENLESANAVLRQAVAAAELLTEALMSEEEKYNNTDPDSGEPLEPLATARIEALAQELESLGNQAESLMGQP